MNEIIYEQSRCIAHEIRNQISICELYTQIIKKNLEKNGIENQSLNNAVKCITKSLKIMSNNLVDLKSLGNFSPKVLNIKDVLIQSINLSTVYISDKNIEIKTELNKDANVFIDENKFLACIINIIKNATEAIREKGEINISLDTDLEFVYIKISNNGDAISEEKQKEIFNEGFTTKSTGSGLGLFICAKNLKAQNATLKLNQSNTQITEFEIVLPIYKT